MPAAHGGGHLGLDRHNTPVIALDDQVHLMVAIDSVFGDDRRRFTNCSGTTASTWPLHPHRSAGVPPGLDAIPVG
jgi:hypothetical protein